MNSPTDPPLSPAAAKRRTQWTELAITVGAAVAIIGFLVFLITQLFENTRPTGLTGIIVEKIERPRNEDTITIGQGGVRAGQEKGDFILKVHVERTGKDYFVFVDPVVFATHSKGDRYFMLQPEQVREADAMAQPDGATTPSPTPAP